MGKKFEDNSIVRNKYYGKEEWDLLADICKELYPKYELMLEMQSSLLDIEARNSALSSKRNVVKNLEAKMIQTYYKDEEDAEDFMRQRRLRRGFVDSDSAMDQDDESAMDEPLDISPDDFEEEEC